VSGLAIRATTPADAPAILALHIAAASRGGGLAREPDEMDLAGIESALAKPFANGVALSAWEDGAIAGEIHASRLGPRQFDNSLTDLTVAVQSARGCSRTCFPARGRSSRRSSGSNSSAAPATLTRCGSTSGWASSSRAAWSAASAWRTGLSRTTC
jgi:hypothetical protein